MPTIVCCLLLLLYSQDAFNSYTFERECHKRKSVDVLWSRSPKGVPTNTYLTYNVYIPINMWGLTYLIIVRNSATTDSSAYDYMISNAHMDHIYTLYPRWDAAC